MFRQFPATTDDFHRLARRRLPRFLYDYYAGGAGRERTLAANADDWDGVKLRQRVLVDVEQIDTTTTMAGEDFAMPLALAPIGLGGMAARRGELKALSAAEAGGVAFTLSTVGICGIDELAEAASRPFWFQLYMIRDRDIVEAVVDQAWAAGCRTLVFTVDLPMPGPRHRETRNGVAMPGLRPKLLKIGQVLAHPGWIWDVALRGRPMSLGSMSPHVHAASDPDSFRQWIDTQFDRSVTWTDIEWLREKWKGRLLLKGILDGADAERAVAVGTDGIVVSNHGGRQLDGVASTATKLPEIVSTVNNRVEVLVDGGICGGIDVFRAIDAGILAALPADELPTADFFPEVVMAENNSRDGVTYAVTEKFGYNTISYNADAVDPADMESLSSVWSEAYDGRISIYDYYLPVMGLAAMAQGIDTADIDAEALGPIGETLAEMRSRAASVAGVVAAQTALATGEVDIVVGGGEWLTAVLAEERPELTWTIPAEGAVRWTQSIGVLEGSEKPDLALEFVKYIVSAEGQARLATSSCFWGMPANAAAGDVLTEEQKAVLRWDDQPDYLARTQLYPAPDFDLDIEMQDLWLNTLQQ